MMIEAMENNEDGILVGGQLVSDVRFADDQGMVANTEEGLQRIMHRFNDTAKKYNMKINVEKTKTMVMSKKEDRVVNITIDGKLVEHVKKFK